MVTLMSNIDVEEAKRGIDYLLETAKKMFFPKETYKNIENAAILAAAVKGDSPKKVLSFIDDNFRGDMSFLEVYENMLYTLATYDFDSFFRYIELDNPKGFYTPRRWYLKPVVETLQRIADGELKMIIVEMPSGTGKSTVVSGYNLWQAGRDPMGSILGAGATGDIASTLYTKIKLMYENYNKRFKKIFPLAEMRKTSELGNSIWLGSEKKEIPTFRAISVSSGSEGATRASIHYYIDDTEQSTWSTDERNKAWNGVLTKVLQRGTGDIPIICVGTARGVDDHQSKLIEYATDMGYKYLRINIPALDANNRSNFECIVYDMSGKPMKNFSTEHFLGKRRALSHNAVNRAKWAAEYMCERIPIDGYMFPSLKRYTREKDILERNSSLKLLPDSEPLFTLAIADTAADGSDSTTAFVADCYDGYTGVMGFVRDIMHDPSGAKVTIKKMCEFIIKNKLTEITIESNTGGSVFADSVEHRLNTEYDYYCKIIKKHTNSNKHGRIEHSSADLFDMLYFLNENEYSKDSEYHKAVDEMSLYTCDGKHVKHDDAPDVAAAITVEMIARYEKFKKQSKYAEVQFMKSFF